MPISSRRHAPQADPDFGCAVFPKQRRNIEVAAIFETAAPLGRGPAVKRDELLSTRIEYRLVPRAAETACIAIIVAVEDRVAG